MIGRSDHRLPSTPQREPAAYVGRFAPSPTGPLHAGSLVAALASWLDARAWNVQGTAGRSGAWLVRIEDVDQPRCVPGAAEFILQQLATCGLLPDAPPQWQSARTALYQTALDQLVRTGHAYPCACSRKDIDAAHAAQGHTRERHTAPVYPGTCRTGLQGKTPRSWRFNTTEFVQNVPLAQIEQGFDAIYFDRSGVMHWHDRRLGAQQQDVAGAVGDFVLLRADGLWAYQLAVVVDDAAQGITHVVRGEDLADNTPRQIALQQALGLRTPQYLHTPLVLGDDGEKLSKQNGAKTVDVSHPVRALVQAAQALGLPDAELSRHTTVAAVLQQCVALWQRHYNRAS